MMVSYKTCYCCRGPGLFVGVARECRGEAALLFLTQEQESEMMMMTTTTAQRDYSVLIMAMKGGHLRVVKVTVSGVETNTRKGTSQKPQQRKKRQQQQHREEVAYIIHNNYLHYSCHGVYILYYLLTFGLVCGMKLMYLYE
jgi:hypothetical protein